MSVLIKGINMPKSCALCFYRDDFHNYCPYEANKERDCPLVEVPTPHGPLIDEQELIKAINEKVDNVSENRGRGATIPSIAWFSGVSSALSIIEDAPTIIEAEEGADHE